MECWEAGFASHSKAGRHFWAGSAAGQLQEDTCQCKDSLKSEAYFLSSGCQENKDLEKLFAWGFNIPGALQGRFCKGVEEGSSQVLVSADPYWRVLIDLWSLLSLRCGEWISQWRGAMWKLPSSQGLPGNQNTTQIFMIVIYGFQTKEPYFS